QSDANGVINWPVCDVVLDHGRIIPLPLAWRVGGRGGREGAPQRRKIAAATHVPMAIIAPFRRSGITPKLSTTRAVNTAILIKASTPEYAPDRGPFPARTRLRRAWAHLSRRR